MYQESAFEMGESAGAFLNPPLLSWERNKPLPGLQEVKAWWSNWRPIGLGVGSVGVCSLMLADEKDPRTVDHGRRLRGQRLFL